MITCYCCIRSIRNVMYTMTNLTSKQFHSIVSTTHVQNMELAPFPIV